MNVSKREEEYLEAMYILHKNKGGLSELRTLPG